MNTLEFYIERFSLVESVSDVDLSFVPSLLKRRLSPLNRVTFYTLNNCYDEDVDLIIYSSQYGEFDKLLKIIQQYSTENTVSPTLFASSVHNSSIGLFSMMKQCNNSYQAISATQNSVSMGLLNAIINDYQNTIFCYSENISDYEQRSVAIKISKNNDACKKRYKFIFDSEEINEHYSEWAILKSFLNDELQELKFKNYKVERINDD